MLAGIKNDLEERLGRPVDIVTYRDSMNPFFKKCVFDCAYVYVYNKTHKIQRRLK